MDFVVSYSSISKFNQYFSLLEHGAKFERKQSTVDAGDGEDGLFFLSSWHGNRKRKERRVDQIWSSL